jgi:hypothetical protein
MKKPGFVLVVVLAGCMGLPPACLAKGRHHKTHPHNEFIGLINGGRPIRIDAIPNQMPRIIYASYSIPLTQDR